MSDDETLRQLQALQEAEERWLNSETLKALVAAERFVADVRGADQGLATAAALWALIGATLDRWRAEANADRHGQIDA